MAHQRSSQRKPPTRVSTNMASAKLCMVVDQQPNFSSLPPQLASMASEVSALISSPHIQRLTRLQGELESESLALEKIYAYEQTEEQVFDRKISSMLLDQRLAGDRTIYRLVNQAKELRKEVSRRGFLTIPLYTRAVAGTVKVLSHDGAHSGSHLASGRFAKVKSLYDMMVEIYSLEIEAFIESRWLFRTSVILSQTESELQRRTVVLLCSPNAAVRPDKAKLGFLIHFANRIEQVVEADNRAVELFRKKTAVKKEMLEHYQKIQQRLAIAVRIQAEHREGKRA